MSIATTTQAQVIDSFGGPDVFRADDQPLVAPVAGQVQVKVAAAGVNPVDLTTRQGKNIHGDAARFPMVIGWDAAGTVEQVGDGVEGWQVGDRVAAMTFQPMDQNGTYAGYVNLAADLVAPVPDNLTLEQAATVPLVGLTGSQLVQWLDLPVGATVLVNGPVGAVGRVVVQLAQRRGIGVVAVAKPADQSYARELGAAEVVDRGDYTAAVRDLYAEGVDAAVDLVGGAAAHAALASVRDGGAYVTVVPPYVDATGPFDTERGIRFEVLIVHPDTTELTALLQAADRGELSTAIEHAYPLDQAAEAHLRQSQGGLRGKLLLLP
jgi:NADPH2:quinone reductase